jgi:hypothetical protein
MYALALVRSPGFRVGIDSSGSTPPAEVGTSHPSSGSMALTVVVLLLIVLVLLFGAMIRGMLATISELMRPVIQLFWLVVLALAITIMLVLA